MINIDDKLVQKLTSLPIDFWDFKNSDTKEFTHGIHNYPAMMVSPISRNIISIMSTFQPIESLLDPFSGSGTVAVEGMLANIPTIMGTDINPLAILLSKTKTTVINYEKLKKESKLLYSNIQKQMPNLTVIDNYFVSEKKLDLTDKKGWGSEAPKYLKEYCEKEKINISIPDFKNIGYWFKPQVIIALEVIKEDIKKIKDENIKNYFLIAFSETIRLVSNRRNGEFKMFRMQTEKVKTFNPDVFNTFKKILDLNVSKMKDFEENQKEKTTKATIVKNNAGKLQDIPDNLFDLVVTSPPYGDSRTTVAYGEYSRLSLQWLDLDDTSSDEIMKIDKSLMGGKKYKKGFDFTLTSPTLKQSLEKIKEKDLERAGDVFSFYEELEEVIKTVASKTKQNGYQFWVVGNRTVKEELLQTDVIMTEMASKYGLKHVHTINRNIPNKVMPSLNSPTNESGKKVTTMTMEHIVIFRKE